MHQVQGEMPKASFDTWVKGAVLMNHDPATNEFTVGLRNAYARDWVESMLATTFTRMLTSFTGAPSRIKFVLIEPGCLSKPERTRRRCNRRRRVGAHEPFRRLASG